MRKGDAATWRRWRAQHVGPVLVLLGLAGIGLPECRAQMEFNGGYVQTHREDHGEVPSLASRQRPARSPAKTPFSYFPDHDFYYPSYYPETTSVGRSYYNTGSEPGRSNLSLSGSERLPINVSASAFPWNQVGFQDYNEPSEIGRSPSRKYSLTTTPLPPTSPIENTGSAALIAHLPEHAVFWVEGTRTRSTGRTRYFQSPPLLPGQKYSYRVRVAWIEGGQWVSQSRQVLVYAGMTQAIYLQPR